MKQKQLLKPLFLLFALLVGGLNSVWAEDVYSTCLFGSDYSQSSNSYTATWTTTNGGFTWSIANGNNNNNTWLYVKFGRKNTESVGSITTSAAYTEAITKVDLTIDAITADKINSIKLYTSSNNSTWTEVGSFTKATGKQSLSLSSPTKNLYYKIEFDCASGSANGLITISKVEYYYEANTSDTRTATTTTIDASGITNTDVYLSTKAGSLSATVKDEDDNTVKGATVTWSGNNDAVATIDATGAVTLVGAGTVTFTATYAGNETDYKPSSATYEMTVTNNDPNANDGSEEKPFTVAEARAAIDAGTGVTGVYVKGIVSEIVTSYSTKYSNITFNIVDNEGDELFLQAYRCIGDKAADVQIGDIVVVSGNLTKYGSTYEFSQGCQLVSLTHTASTTPVINASDVELTYDATSGEIAYEVANAVTGVSLNATTDDDWISNITVAADKVTFTTTANEGTTDRTATITLSYTGATDKAITITQAHYVAEVATLPFNWEGGASSELLNTAGVTANGLGSDYGTSNSPYLVKFDTTGDYIQVKTDGQPGKVTIEVKMIGGSTASSINVQGSADGETFTDVETLSISGSQNSTLSLETTKPFAADVRYVRLVFTKGSNVGVGAITIAKPSTDPEIIADSKVELTADATSGEIAYSINNPVAETSLTASTTETWITDITVGTDKVTFTISANTGDERTGTITLTYGTLTKDVTVTQAKYVAPAEEYTWVKTELANLSATDVFVIVGNNGSTYAMSNDNGTGSAPIATAVNITGNIWTGAIADNLLWNVSGNATDGYTFYPNGTTETWLYCTNTNNGVRVGTNADNNTFTLDGDYLKNTATSRYVGIYNSQDWRCYDSNGGNIENQTFAFYKKADASVTISSVGYKAYNTTIDTDFSGTGVTAYVVTGYTKESVTLEEVTAAPAGTPLVLKGDEGTYALNKAENAADPATNNLLTDNLLQVSNGTVGDGSTIYALANVNGPGFYVVKSGLTIPTNYIVIPAGNAPALSFDFGEGTTGIRSIENGQLTIDNVYYDLSGRKLNAMPTQKGVYIVNGKKVVIK